MAAIVRSRSTFGEVLTRASPDPSRGNTSGCIEQAARPVLSAPRAAVKTSPILAVVTLSSIFVWPSAVKMNFIPPVSAGAAVPMGYLSLFPLLLTSLLDSTRFSEKLICFFQSATSLDQYFLSTIPCRERDDIILSSTMWSKKSLTDMTFQPYSSNKSPNLIVRQEFAAGSLREMDRLRNPETKKPSTRNSPAPGAKARKRNALGVRVTFRSVKTSYASIGKKIAPSDAISEIITCRVLSQYSTKIYSLIPHK